MLWNGTAHSAISKETDSDEVSDRSAHTRGIDSATVLPLTKVAQHIFRNARPQPTERLPPREESLAIGRRNPSSVRAADDTPGAPEILTSTPAP